MSLRVNSILAYYSSRKEFSKREMLILGWLLMNPGEWTDRQIKTGLEQGDMNAVRPRINELLELGALEECGSVNCTVTGKLVRMVKISDAFVGMRIARQDRQKHGAEPQRVQAGAYRQGRYVIPQAGQCGLFK